MTGTKTDIPNRYIPQGYPGLSDPKIKSPQSASEHSLNQPRQIKKIKKTAHRSDVNCKFQKDVNCKYKQ